MIRFMLCILLALSFALPHPANAEGPLRKMLREHRQQRDQAKKHYQTTQIAGLNIAYWLPEKTDTPSPLIIFSHGFHGCKTQSVFLMQALADDGYIVVAPDHKDASCNGGRLQRVEEGFGHAGKWTDQTYLDRHDDIIALYDGLKRDKDFSAMIDWDCVGLAGHSLGGYTVLGLAGAWPSWKMPGIRAVLALSPYTAPYADHGDLAHLSVPVMYQGGTRDFGITPKLKKPSGTYDQTSGPAFFVEFDKTGHFGWTDLQKGAQENVIRYSLWFFDATLRGGDSAPPQAEGVTDFKSKK